MTQHTLLVTDLDGTLLDPASLLPAKNIIALQNWVDGGNTLALATGRNLTITQAIAEAIGREMYLILQDGGLVLHYPSLAALVWHNLATETAQAARAIFAEQALPVMVFDPLPEGQHFTVFTHGAPLSGGMQAYLRTKSARFSLNNRLDSLPATPSKIVTLDDQPKTARIYASLQARLPQARVIRTEAVRLGGWFVEVGSPLASKAQGLQTLLRHLNRSADEVIAIGDAENDVEILQMAGLGVAVENASARVKAAARRVIGSNAGAAVADFLQEYGR